MSAPQIPHLNTLRRGGGRGRGRGRGTNPGDPAENHESRSLLKDRIVQQTDTDAATSRLGAVESGYLDDPFAKLLVASGNVERRLPLMNRGTYVRTTAIDCLIDHFLSSDPGSTRQIISLGSGSDTRFFRMKQKHQDAHLIYHEFDFPVNTAAKIQQLQTPPLVHTIKRLCNIDLQQQCNVIAKDAAGDVSIRIHADNSEYHLHPLDLRTIAETERQGSTVEGYFEKWKISPDVPTVVLSECCLVYLPPEDADLVISFFTKAFQPATPIGVVIYEPIRPHDAFGRTMVSNLTARGIHLQTLNANDTLKAQKKRLRRFGFGGTQGRDSAKAEAADVDFVWQKWIGEEEKERVEGLEWMDEVEEWRLLARHYCVAWAWKEASVCEGESVHRFSFRKWAELPAQSDED